MCQGLLYAFCYHLDSLLGTDAANTDSLDPSQLHISDEAPAASAPREKTCMQPAEIRRTLSDLLPGVLHHRYLLHQMPVTIVDAVLLLCMWLRLVLACVHLTLLALAPVTVTTC